MPGANCGGLVDRSNVNILLAEVLVLMTIGWIATLYAWRQNRLRQQRTWQWWHQQQTLQSHHTAEAIRDGLLQQTFGFRRYLESAIHGETTPVPVTLEVNEQTTRWLTRFQTFYQSLETLSDELSPPFVADSLPLALQFMLKNWERSHPSNPSPNIQLQLPAHWPQTPPGQNQIILSIVTELLTLLVREKAIAQTLSVVLKHEDNSYALIFEINNSLNQSTSKILELAEFQHLKEIFHSLTAGQLEISKDPSSLIIQLRWQASTFSPVAIQ